MKNKTIQMGLNKFSRIEREKEDKAGKAFEQECRKRPGVIDLVSASTMNILSEQEATAIINKCAKDMPSLMTRYPNIIPDSSLQDAISSQLAEAGFSIKAENIAVFRGVLSGAFSTISLFKNQEFVILPERVYVNHKAAFASYGKSVIETKTDENGLFDLTELSKILEGLRGKVSFVYFYSLYGKIPDRQYIGALLNLVRRENVLLVYDSDLAFTSHNNEKARHALPFDAQDIDNVIVLCNLTKEFGAPGIRVSYGIASRALVKQISHFQHECIEMLSLVDRKIATSVVEDADINKTRTMLRSRMEALVNGLNSLGWKLKLPDTGVNLFVEVPKGFAQIGSASGSELFHFYLLTELGILGRPGSAHSARERNKIRFVISQPKEKVDEVIKRMKAAEVSPEMAVPKGLESEYLKFVGGKI